MKMIEFRFKFHWNLLPGVQIQIQISLKFIPRCPTDNKPALVKVMAWHQTGDKPLPKPVMAQFIDAYMWHEGEMN